MIATANSVGRTPSSLTFSEGLVNMPPEMTERPCPDCRIPLVWIDDMTGYRCQKCTVFWALQRVRVKAREGWTPQVGGQCTVHNQGHPMIARVMAIADGYAMLRYPRCVPFVKRLTDLREVKE